MGHLRPKKKEGRFPLRDQEILETKQRKPTSEAANGFTIFEARAIRTSMKREGEQYMTPCHRGWDRSSYG
jgi:hypothetical protein